jgi:small subunit ribosomal protein S7
MSRRQVAKKRNIQPDPLYRSRLVSMMIARLLKNGKKSVASRVLYDSFEKITATLESQNRSDSKAQAGKQNTPETQPRSQPKVNELPSPRSGGLSDGETGVETLKIFQNAIVNVTPLVETKSRRVGGSNMQIPLEVDAERGTALALRWLVQAARQRPGREMAMKLANELMDANNKTGNAIRKREETHKMAEANKAYANYRF